MADPLFWLALSFLLVVVSLTAVLMVAIPAMRELGRAARSAEKMFDTLSRELPPTLEAIRLTGLEITELTDDVTDGVQSAGQVVQQVNQSLTSAQTGAKRLNTGTRSFLAGARAAWQAWTEEPPAQLQRPTPRSPQAPPDLAPRPRASRDGQSHISAPQGHYSPETDRSLEPPTSDRSLPGQAEHSQPRLGETSLRAMPDAELAPASPAELPELSPRGSAQESSRPASDRD